RAALCAGARRQDRFRHAAAGRQRRGGRDPRRRPSRRRALEGVAAGSWPPPGHRRRPGLPAVEPRPVGALQVDAPAPSEERLLLASAAGVWILIADVFEALTAADRPYKRAKTLSESFKILAAMKREHHL